MQIERALTAQRITIRDYRKSDLPFVTAMWFDPENGKYMSDPTEEYVDDKYQQALDEMEDNPEGYYLTVMSNDTGDVIGTCCMFPDEKKEVYDIGYCIHKQYWRQGYGSELISLLIDWVRAHRGSGQGESRLQPAAAKARLSGRARSFLPKVSYGHLF